MLTLEIPAELRVVECSEPEIYVARKWIDEQIRMEEKEDGIPYAVCECPPLHVWRHGV